jgi:hypothetical protein
MKYKFREQESPIMCNNLTMASNNLPRIKYEQAEVYW